MTDLVPAPVVQNDDDFWDEASDEDFQRLSRTLKASIAPTLDPVLWEELSAREFPENRWRIRDLVPSAGLVILAAASSERKSWLALSMAHAIASGTPFLGEDKFVTETGNVLYLDGEMAASELQRRGRLLGISSGAGKLYVASCDTLNLNKQNGVEALLDFVRAKSITTVLIDTFRALATGIREEKAEEVRAFFNSLKPLKTEGVAVVLLDHRRKPAPFESAKLPKKDSLLGSVDKTASSDVVLMLVPGDEPGEIAVHQVKNRLGSELPPFKILMADEKDADGKTRAVRLSYGGPIGEEATKKEEAMDAIIEVLEASGGAMTTKEIIATMQTRRVGQKNTRSALRELRSARLVMHEKRGREDCFSPINPANTLIPPEQNENSAAIF